MQQQGNQIDVNPQRLITILQKQLAEANSRAARWQAVAEELLVQQQQAQGDQPDTNEEVRSDD